MEDDPAMAKMLERARKMKEREQRRLAAMRVRSTYGKGKVSAEMDGHKTLLSIRIDPGLLRAESLPELEELIIKAVNSVNAKIDKKRPPGMFDHMPSFFSDDEPFG